MLIQYWSIGLHKAKRSLMSWVVVITKEGRAQVAAPTLLFVWKRLFIIFGKKIFLKNFFFLFFFFGKVGVIPKEGRARPRAPVLRLVWQRLRTLGTFSRNAAQLINIGLTFHGWFYNAFERLNKSTDTPYTCLQFTHKYHC